MRIELRALENEDNKPDEELDMVLRDPSPEKAMIEDGPSQNLDLDVHQSPQDEYFMQLQENMCERIAIQTWKLEQNQWRL